MKKMPLYRFGFLCVMLAVAISCKDSWNDHTSIDKDVSTETLYQFLGADGRFSQFTKLLAEFNLDEELNSARQITVFAPDNDAMAKVPQEYLDNEASKELFVKHHIAYGRYNKELIKDKVKIKMLSGKWLVFEDNEVDGIDITGSSPAQMNGFVNYVNEAILPKPNLFQYIEELAPDNKHVNFLNSLTKLTFDPELSEQIGVDEYGQAVYDSVFIYRNSFNDDIADLSAEDSTLTLFVVTDEVFEAEYEKFKNCFKVVGDPLSPLNIAETNLQISRDYVFTEAYAQENIPSVLVSQYGVNVPFDETKVVSHFKASNGYVYILSSCPVELGDRIRPIIVEGENPDAYYGMPTEKAQAEGYLRIREYASGGHDFVLDNHIAGSSQKLSDGLILPVGYIPSLRYDVYLRAINDFRTSYRYPNDNELQQRLGTCAPRTIDPVSGRVLSFAPPVYFSDTIAVTASEYSPNPLEDEVYVGSFNIGTLRDVFLQIVPTGEGTQYMAVTVDYVKLVPVFN